MNKGNKMKLITTLFLILTSTAVLAYPEMSISQRCGYGQVEGKKIFKSYGRVARECFNKNSVPETYETSDDSKCTKSHVAGPRSSYSKGYVTKSCVSRLSLGETYYTDKNTSCSKGYSSDGVSLWTEFDYPAKVCVRYFL
jgi:hypothetical protein